MLKFTEWPKTLGMTSKKTVLSMKVISSFAGDFVLIWTKQRLIGFRLQRDGTRNGQRDFGRKFAAKNVSSLHQSMSIFQGWSQIHVMAGQNKSKEKVPYVSDPNQSLETTCNSKLKFTLLKDLFIKRVQKN